MTAYAEEAVSGRPPAFWSLVGLKAALVVLLLIPALNPDWQQYEDKGMHWRVLGFPLVALVIPVLWRLAGSPPPYPYLADLLLVVVPLTDVLWNTVDAYDRLWWWDDLNHLLNSVVIASAIGLWARRYPLGPVVGFGFVLGIGMTLAVGWELAEYAAGVAGSSELQTYGDTVGDLGLALVGSTFAAALAARQPGVGASHLYEVEPAGAGVPVNGAKDEHDVVPRADTHQPAEGRRGSARGMSPSRPCRT